MRRALPALSLWITLLGVAAVILAVYAYGACSSMYVPVPS